MANLLEGLLLEEGQSGAYIPNAHENIDEEIEKNGKEENFVFDEGGMPFVPDYEVGLGGESDLLSTLGLMALVTRPGIKATRGFMNILKKNKEAIKNLKKMKEKEALEVWKKRNLGRKTAKIDINEAAKAFKKSNLGKPTADKYKALSRQDSKNKMMTELLTVSSIGLPALATMIGKTKGWPAKLAEIFSPDPVDEYPIEGNIPDMKDFFDMLEEREKLQGSIDI